MRFWGNHKFQNVFFELNDRFRGAIISKILVFLCGLFLLQSASADKVRVDILNGEVVGVFHFGLYETFDQAFSECEKAMIGVNWSRPRPSCHKWFTDFTGTHMEGVEVIGCFFFPSSDMNCPNFYVRYIVGSCDSPYKFNKITGECGTDEQNGPPPSLSCVGDPIDLVTGNVYEEEQDYSILGSDLKFSRHYNSADGVWRHNFSTHLSFSQDKIALVKMTGKTYFYNVVGGVVSGGGLGSGGLTKLSGSWVYIDIDNQKYSFDKFGRLTSWRTNSGELLSLDYVEGKVSVISSSGKNIVFTQDDRFQPISLSAQGVIVNYAYSQDVNSPSRLIKVNSSYDGVLNSREYAYEDPVNSYLLTSIIDERGVKYVAWKYDAKGRAIENQRSGGGRMLVEYLNSMRTTTNELGIRTSYIVEDFGGRGLVTYIGAGPTNNCPYSDSSYTYNAAGQMLSKTDAEGNVTKYSYNERGLEVSRIEASGSLMARTISTEWDPQHYLKTKITEPTRITLFTYDEVGRIVSQQVIKK
ncbi:MULTISPECIES: DUF6531 domain-containing protein [unclassified Pseudomonas]|uniref:DUF6531 domain-containing protein n=1 Tax=unclassified Pseudomonas TaxID=196821 RepID=UPI000A1F1CC3|nr:MULTISPECIES: DUF6531 domain-containing protein [unclassified Pseudomonas]